MSYRFMLPRPDLSPPVIFGKKISWSAFIGIILILQWAIFPPLLGWGGRDFMDYYRQATLSQNYGVRTWNPYPTYWFIYPFAILPPTIGYLLWNLSTAASFIYAIHHFKGRYLNFAISLPCFWIFFAGQMEGFLALGAALTFAANPYVVGIGLTLLSFKPQLGLFPILFVLLRRREWRIYVVPALIYALSLVYWGWWLPEWFHSLIDSAAPQGYTNISLFPFSLIFLPLLLWAFSSYHVWLLVGSLVPPYFAVYSLAVLFCIEAPLWAGLGFWLLYLAANNLPYQVPGYLIPLAMLAAVIWRIRQAKSDPAPQVAA